MGLRFRPKKTAMGLAVQTREGSHYQRLEGVALHDCRRMARASMKTMICVPIIAQNRAFGSIGVAMRREDENFTRDLAILNALGRCLGTQLLVVDQISKLSQQAETDALTQAFNRHFYYDCIKGHWARWVTEGRGFSVLSIDLDHFKRINDRYGHDFGDTVLKEVARWMRLACRVEDHVIRMGGEEFCILLDNGLPYVAQAFAERIRYAISSEPVACGDVVASVTASVGVASVTLSYRTYESVVSRADAATYRAKKTGRNRVCDV